MEDISEEAESADAVSTLIPNAFEVSCLLFMAIVNWLRKSPIFDFLSIGLFSLLWPRSLIIYNNMRGKILSICFGSNNKLKYDI